MHGNEKLSICSHYLQVNLGRAVQRMLTRQEFATVQSHLSTVYFSSSAVLASFSLGSFLLRHPINTWSKEATNLVRS